MPVVKISRDNIQPLMDIVKIQDPDTNEYKAFRRYNVCTASLITSLSYDLWNMYHDLNGLKNENLTTYRELTPLWIKACRIIRHEINQIDCERASTEQARMEQSFKKNKNKRN
jgi:hypothetical protein